MCIRDRAKSVGEVLNVKIEDGFFKAEVKEYIFDEENFESNENIEALKKMLVEDFRSYVSIDNSIPPEIAFSLVEIENIDKLANLITYYLPLSPKENYSLLKELDIEEKLINLHRLIQKMCIRDRWISTQQHLFLEEKQHQDILEQKQ